MIDELLLDEISLVRITQSAQISKEKIYSLGL